MPISYTWDPSKNRSNTRDHGIDFTAAERFDWDLAVVTVDDREDYGELREIAVSFVGDVLHVMVYTVRDDAVHVISLRKASKRERRDYAR